MCAKKNNEEPQKEKGENKPPKKLRPVLKIKFRTKMDWKDLLK